MVAGMMTMMMKFDEDDMMAKWCRLPVFLAPLSLPPLFVQKTAFEPPWTFLYQLENHAFDYYHFQNHHHFHPVREKNHHDQHT